MDREEKAQQIAQEIGEDHQAQNIANALEWHGAAAVENARQRARETTDESRRGRIFFDALNADQRAREANGTWPDQKYRDWKNQEP